MMKNLLPLQGASNTPQGHLHQTIRFAYKRQ